MGTGHEWYWCYTTATILQKILKVRKSTAACTVLGECGRIIPLSLLIRSRMFSFWLKLKNANNSNKLSSVVNKILLKLHERNISKSSNTNTVQTTMQDLGLSISIPLDGDRIKNPANKSYFHQWDITWTGNPCSCSDVHRISFSERSSFIPCQSPERAARNLGCGVWPRGSCEQMSSLPRQVVEFDSMQTFAS